MVNLQKLLLDLFQAYYDARKNKRNTVNQLKFEIDYEHKLFQLFEDITNREYKIAPSICFVVTKPVKREIFAADFKDRVVHHLIFNYINPILEPQFIEDSYSCRKGKGTLYGIRRVEGFIKDCSENYTKDCYILQLDISGYFMNINRKILKEKLDRMIYLHKESCDFDFDTVMYLINEVLDNDPTLSCIFKGKPIDWDGMPKNKSLFHSPENCGLPIGNLTSQLFSNVYLSDFDYYVKDTLGMKYYGRYVDDFVIVHQDKEYLKEINKKIREYLKDKFELDIHPNKIYLQHYVKGICFLGAMIKPYRTYISNRTKKKFWECIHYWEIYLNQHEPSNKDLEKMRASLNSYLGIMKHHKTYRVKYKILFKGAHKIFKYGFFSNHLNRYVLKRMPGKNFDGDEE